jgi:hypothetical protein
MKNLLLQLPIGAAVACDGNGAAAVHAMVAGSMVPTSASAHGTRLPAARQRVDVPALAGLDVFADAVTAPPPRGAPV